MTQETFEYVYVQPEERDPNLGDFIRGRVVLSNAPMEEEELQLYNCVLIEDPAQREKFLSPGVTALFLDGKPYATFAQRSSKFDVYDPLTDSFFIPEERQLEASEYFLLESKASIEFLLAGIKEELQATFKDIAIFDSMLTTYNLPGRKEIIDPIINPQVTPIMLKIYKDVKFKTYTGDDGNIKEFMANFLTLRQNGETGKQFFERMYQRRGERANQLLKLTDFETYVLHVLSISTNPELVKYYGQKMRDFTLDDFLSLESL